MKTNVLEIFNSIAGEVTPYHQGCLTTFVRLAGCNLNCSYCDTPTAHDTGELLSENELANRIQKKYAHTGRLCITGGEPLLQMDSVLFLIKLFRNSWIETNGTIDFSKIIGWTTIVADYKIEEMDDFPLYFYTLKQSDFIKFVIGDNSDVNQALYVQKSLQIGGVIANFAYSPMFKKMEVGSLMNKLLIYGLPNTIINTQMHKYLELK